MSESTKAVQSDQASTSPNGCPDSGLDGGLDDVPQGSSGQGSPTVRELLAELAKLEDATRGLGGVRRPTWTVQTPDLLAALAREQEIIDELHRRCPDARPTTSSTTSPAATADENGAAGQAD